MSGYMDTKFCALCDADYDWAAPECPGCAHRRYSEAQEQQIANLKAEVARLRDLLRDAHRELSTIEAITVSPSDTDGLITLVKKIEEAL